MEAVIDVVPPDAGAPRSFEAERAASPPRPDPGLRGLVLLAQFHGIPADAAQMRHDAGIGDRDFAEADLLIAARRLGLKARVIEQPAARIDRVALPALALSGDGDTFVIARASADKVLVQDPVEARPIVLGIEDFGSRYRERLMTVASRASLSRRSSTADGHPYGWWRGDARATAAIDRSE